MGRPATVKRVMKDPKLKSIMYTALALRLSEEQITRELSEAGYKISRSTIYKMKNKLRTDLQIQINDAFSYEILHEHFNTINAIKEGQRRLWELSKHPSIQDDPYKQAEIITQAINTYPFLTGYYLNIKKVMAQHKTLKIQSDITV